ncbi:MAG: twin-arginine translocase TatA/TatE family subunit [Selenomonadaceae bacterium]|nr:twin-arginine translocase TatA/TatE family subunit [Selenomonadaceae bacterium]
MFGIGAGEFVVILIVALIVFGPSKLPEVGRAIGKGIREFRKAQAALSQTLNSVDEPEKKSPPAEKPVEEKTSPVAQTPAEKTSVEKPVTEKTSPPTVTADEVIKLAKQSPLVKENQHEKISDGNSVDATANAERTSPAGSRSSSNSVDKQP